MIKNEQIVRRDIRQVHRETAEKFAAAKASGDLAAAEEAVREFSEQMRLFRDRVPAIESALGRNFLGGAAWQKIGIDVGEAPPIPEAITPELLERSCPFIPDKQMKDTHLLVLVPHRVNGWALSPKNLNFVCESHNRSGRALINHEFDVWQGEAWASQPQSHSEWVLLSKVNPDGDAVPSSQHFWNKAIRGQEKVHENHYPEYREGKALEVMTGVLLSILVNNHGFLWKKYVRCQEPCPAGGRVMVGHHDYAGVKIHTRDYNYPNQSIGRALVWDVDAAETSQQNMNSTGAQGTAPGALRRALESLGGLYQRVWPWG